MMADLKSDLRIDTSPGAPAFWHRKPIGLVELNCPNPPLPLVSLLSITIAGRMNCGITVASLLKSSQHKSQIF